MQCGTQSISPNSPSSPLSCQATALPQTRNCEALTASKHNPECAEGWDRAIRSFPRDGDKAATELRDASMRFLTTSWLDRALVAGWDELEIWGCYPAPLEFARRRYDCLGLVPSLVTGRGCSLAGIDHEGATLTRRDTKAVLRHPRELPGREWAQPWWQALSATATGAAA